jgi:hypothetical protein
MVLMLVVDTQVAEGAQDTQVAKGLMVGMLLWVIQVVRE